MKYMTCITNEFHSPDRKRSPAEMPDLTWIETGPRTESRPFPTVIESMVRMPYPTFN
jgi:hypothetical protein